MGKVELEYIYMYVCVYIHTYIILQYTTLHYIALHYIHTYAKCTDVKETAEANPGTSLKLIKVAPPVIRIYNSTLWWFTLIVGHWGVPKTAIQTINTRKTFV